MGGAVGVLPVELFLDSSLLTLVDSVRALKVERTEILYGVSTGVLPPLYTEIHRSLNPHRFLARKSPRPAASVRHG